MGFVILERQTEDGPEFGWFLGLDGDEVASSYGGFASVDQAIAAIRQIQLADLRDEPIEVRVDTGTWVVD